jgi:hypothetical protein
LIRLKGGARRLTENPSKFSLTETEARDMALFGDVAKAAGGAGPVVLVGVGALILGPRLLRMAGRATRPVAKTVIRTVARTAGAAREGFEDIVEQSRTEVEEAAKAGGARASRPRHRAVSKHHRAAPRATA